MDKFQDRFRIQSARLQKWDYRRSASYFITICTGGGVHSFGRIEDGKMVLSPAGIVADILWHETKNHFHHIELGEFVVMPNHVHGIIIITGNENDEIKQHTIGTTRSVETLRSVKTLHATSLQTDHLQTTHPQTIQSNSTPLQPTNSQTNQFYSGISPKSNSVSVIVRSHKSAVTKHINRLKLCAGFSWQTRFYDHIIRDDSEFNNITWYIRNNPEKWNDDKFYNLNYTL